MLHWLVIMVLAVFVYRQAEAIRRLDARLDAALKALTRRDEPPVESTWAAPADPRWAPVSEPGTPATPDTTPSPERPSTPRPATARIEPPVTRPAPAFDRRFAEEEPPARDPRNSRAAVSTWLAENGLAWIGGGGLALGGLLLVVYAAQQGVFTPTLRIGAAGVLGVLMIAASEWIVRQQRAPGGRHLLAAAVAAGAGAVTLYGAVCAAYALYGLIPFAVAAGLTGLISLGLLGLSLRHGEPLALLAIVGAVITPWVTGVETWAPGVLLAWGALIGVTGFVISATRLWGYAAVVTVVGLVLLSFIPTLDGGAALILLAAVGPAGAVLWRRRRATAEADTPSRAVLDRQPMIALILAALASCHPWFHDLTISGHLPVGVGLSGALVVLGAAMAALRVTPAMTFAAPVAMAVLSILLTLTFGGSDPYVRAGLPWLHGLTALIPLSALVGALNTTGRRRTLLLGVGAVGVAVLSSLAWFLLDAAELRLSWLPTALLGGVMFGAAALIARRSDPARIDRGLILWLAAAAEMSFLAIHAALPGRFEPLAFA
ncbi:MAG: DUF2339 domain-containing protein, partial [Brevundimonas sp.]